MTFFLPPSDARECQRRVIHWLVPLGYSAPHNVWMRGDVVEGTLVAWGSDPVGHVMIPVKRGDPRAVATAGKPY